MIRVDPRPVLFYFYFFIRSELVRVELIRPGLAVRVDPVRLLYLPFSLSFCGKCVAANFSIFERFKIKRPPKWWMSQYEYNKHNTTWRVLCFCIRNLTCLLRSLVRFLIHQQLVRKYRTPALSMKYSLYVHPKNSNNLRSHSRAIMALHYSRLDLQDKFLAEFFAFQWQVYVTKFCQHIWGYVNQPFILFIHHIWGETVLWVTVFII